MALIKLTGATDGDVLTVNTNSIQAINSAEHGSTIKLGPMNFVRVSEKPKQVLEIASRACPKFAAKFNTIKQSKRP